MTVFKRSQAKYVKQSHATTNWSEYESGLRQRASLTVWISENELMTWGPSARRRRKSGGQLRYSNQAIETALTVGMVFHLALRQTEGFLRSLFALLSLDCRVTPERRGQSLRDESWRLVAGGRPPWRPT